MSWSMTMAFHVFLFGGQQWWISFSFKLVWVGGVSGYFSAKAGLEWKVSSLVHVQPDKPNLCILLYRKHFLFK